MGTTGRFGWTSPRYQITTLYAAANVLAQRGDEAACRAVLSELREVRAGYREELRTAGIEPGEVTSWRQEQVLAARPIAELEGSMVSADDVIGADLRNPRDEQLGSIDDVIVDPRSGRITYVIVARGGFLGIGEDHVAVPWNRLRATPGMNTFVLDATEAVVAEAPRVDPNAFGDPQSYQQRTTAVDRYWQAQDAG